MNMGFEGQLDENVRFRALKPLLSHHSGDSQTLLGSDAQWNENSR
ncbi:hypothetical protein D4081_24320 [Shigella flexneri]|nr:hypothetical protein [Salmonella enterica]EBY3053118.1 hypothetical protein [Salmonella enterica subsp. enterica serovar Newport]EFX8333212.1 hypothetical protein [Shigella flexneri]RIE76321.1 hypothetical protein UL72_19575 [Shigella dysenteriae]EBY3053232.1 hypothetical protein [Salmonella enterica subsp. enterica serovar Newport]